MIVSLGHFYCIHVSMLLSSGLWSCMIPCSDIYDLYLTSFHVCLLCHRSRHVCAEQLDCHFVSTGLDQQSEIVIYTSMEASLARRTNHLIHRLLGRGGLWQTWTDLDAVLGHCPGPTTMGLVLNWLNWLKTSGGSARCACTSSGGVKASHWETLI